MALRRAYIKKAGWRVGAAHEAQYEHPSQHVDVEVDARERVCSGDGTVQCDLRELPLRAPEMNPAVPGSYRTTG